MAIEKKLIHFKKLATFEKELNAGNILNTSIIFIQDAKLIWTHGEFYNDQSEIYSQLEEIITKIENNDLVIAQSLVDLNKKISNITDNNVVLEESINDLSSELQGLSGANLGLSEDYVEVAYPEDTGTYEYIPPKPNDSLDTAVNKIETNISTLVQEVLNDEEVWAAALNELNEKTELSEEFVEITYPEVSDHNITFTPSKSGDGLEDSVSKIESTIANLIQGVIDNEKVTVLSISNLEEKVNNLNELESTVQENTSTIESLDNLLKANNPPVASPVISVTWTFTDINGNDVTSSIQNIGNAKNPKVERGYIAGYSATYNYTIGSNQQAPSGVVSGSSWTTVPEILSGNTSEASELISSSNISTNTGLSITLKAKQVGLKVSNGIVSQTTENDFIKSTTDTAGVTFYNRKFYGLTDDTEITSDTLNNLSGNVLTDIKGLTTEKITTKTQHYVFAYPERLSKIKANGADAWDKTIITEQGFIENSFTLTNNAGEEILYYTYRTTNIGALDNTELDFS